ncbi:MAG: TIGR02301 family protein [Beijerinckiaceae bacterium]
MLAWPVEAQQRQGTRPAPPPAKEEPPPEPPPLAYEADLLRLSEILGTLSYMHALCKVSSSDSWRQRMTQLIEAEGNTRQRKERLAGAFNRGFTGHQPSHRACTDSARLVIDRLVLQGQQIAREISSRYSG